MTQRPGADSTRKRRIVQGAVAGVAVLLLAANGVLLYLHLRPAPPVAIAPPREIVALPPRPPEAAAVAPPPEVAALPPVALRPPEPPAPERTPRPAVIAGYAEILGNVSRELRLFRYAGNPDILILDFPSLHAQALALNRIAALVEKSGAPRDRVLSDSEFQGFLQASGARFDTFYYGHDYRAADLVRFFNLARSGGIALNPAEEELAGILVDQEVMRAETGLFRPIEPGKALITLVQVQPDNPETAAPDGVDVRLRDTILRHELSHGEFFTNRTYRDYATRFWHERMTEGDRMAFRAFLAGEGYDSGNEDMMVNEMQAYLLHTPDPRAFSAAMLGMTQTAVAQLRQRFLAAAPPSPVFDRGIPPPPVRRTD